MKRWYVVHTRHFQEEKATFNLGKQGFAFYLPKYLKPRRHARRKDLVLKPLFPRYLFVQWDMEIDPWRSVYGTTGVIQILGSAEQPTPIPDSVIEAIKSREKIDGIVQIEQPKFDKGQQLRITEGPFSEHVGMFEEMADDERVTLLLNLMGRQIRVKAPIENLAR